MTLNRVLFVVAIFFSSVGLAHAAVVSNLSIYNPLTSLNKADNTYSVSFDVYNPDSVPHNEVRYAIQLADENKHIIYTSEASSVSVLSGETKRVSVSFATPSYIQGKMQVIALVQNQSGSVMSVANAGSIVVDGVSAKSSNKNNTLTKQFVCDFHTNESDQSQSYDCAVSKKNLRVRYSFLKGGILGSEVKKGEVKASDDGYAHIPLSALHGRYGVKAYLVDKDDAIVAEQSDVFTPTSGWIAVSGFKESARTKTNLTMKIFLEGSGENPDRGLIYGLVDSHGTVCGLVQELKLEYTVPSERTLSIDIPHKCKKVTFAGALYSGSDKSGAKRIIQKFGSDQAVSNIIKMNGVTPSALSITQKTMDFLKNINNWVAMLIVLIIGLLISFIGMKIHNKKALLLLMVSVGLLGFSNFAHAYTFKSYDNPNIATFTVNFTQGTTFSNTKNVVFDFAINYGADATVAMQRAAAVWVSVDNGASTQIIAPGSARNGVPVQITLPPITTGGTHTLNFTVSGGLCGAFFGYSTFDNSSFGTTDCLSSTAGSPTVSITTNKAPSKPTLRQSTYRVDAANPLDFSSVDTDTGDRLYYQVNYNDGGGIHRVPSTGTVSPSPISAHTTYSGWTTQGNKTLQAQAIDAAGAASGWKTYTLSRELVCAPSVAVCDGGAAAATFYAKPSLVGRGATTKLYWTLGNVRNCSISGDNGDSIGWSTIQNTTQATTGTINKSTRYTLQCSDFDTGTISTTTTVHIGPKWQEF